MAERTQTQVNVEAQPSVTSAPMGLLQRKCGCGKSVELGKQGGFGDRALVQQEGEREQGEETEAPPVLHDLLGSALPTIQPKLKIGPPNDKYEQEADRVADQVMRMPKPTVQRQMEPEEAGTIQTKSIASQISPLIQRQMVVAEESLVQARADSKIQRREAAAAEKEEEEPLQTKRTSDLSPSITPAIQSRIQSLRQSSGQPLPLNIRAFMESQFGHDFSHVRIHTDTAAAKMATAIGARAFTLKHDLFFGAGQYHPVTAQTQRLLAHELTHVIQQQGLDKHSLIQTDFAITPSKPLPEQPENLLEQNKIDVDKAITTNSQLMRNPQEIENLRDILGIDRNPNIDEAFVQSVANFQYQFDLSITGIVDKQTQQQLTLEKSAESRVNFSELGAICTPQDFTNPDDISCAWHKIIPIGQGRITVSRESQPGKRGKPGTQSAAQLKKTNKGKSSLAREPLKILLNSVEQNLNNEQIPRVSGNLKVNKSGGQIQFQSGSTENTQESRDFFKFFNDTLNLNSDKALEKVLGRKPTSLEKAFWPAYKVLLKTEKDPAAINAVARKGNLPTFTLGAGLATQPSAAKNKDFNMQNSLDFLRSSELPSEFHLKLYKVGIRVPKDGGIQVLDTERGFVEEDPRNAILLISSDQRRLSTFINLAQSKETVKSKNQDVELRLLVWRAQFFVTLNIFRKGGFHTGFTRWSKPGNESHLWFATKLFWGQPSKVKWSKLHVALTLGGDKGIRKIIEVAHNSKVSFKKMCKMSATKSTSSPKARVNRILKDDGRCP